MAYYETIFTFKVYSDRPINPDMELGDIVSECVDGDMVGSTEVREERQITSQQMAQKLYEVGSDPGFFELDDDGNRIDY